MKKLPGFDGFSVEYLLTVPLESVTFLTKGEKQRIERWRNKGERDRFLKSDEWRAIRDHVLDRDGKTCKKCGSAELPCVDHILPRSKFKHLQLEPNNLQVLCWLCNREKAARIVQQPA